MITLRPYQEEALEALERHRLSGSQSGLIVAATGVGKRKMAVDYARKFKKVLFLAHREELIEQAAADFEEEYPMQVGMIKGPLNELNKHITIASVQTIYRRLDNIPKRLFDCVIVDECHHYMAKSYSHSVLHFDSEFRVGYTATPTRLDGLSLVNLFEKIVFDYPIDRAIKDGYLCEIEAMRVKTDIDLTKVHTRMGDFASDELSRSVDIPERNKLVVQKYTQYGKGRQCIVFAVDIKHAQNLKAEFESEGYSASTIHSNLSKEERKGIIDRFKSGNLDILTNCEILTEGFDYSDIGCLCMARPTKSLALYMQMIGRATRLKSDLFRFNHNKNNAIILDFVDNVGKHQLINCWELEKTKPIEEKIFISEERKNKLIEARLARENEEKERRKALIDRLYKHDKKINLLELPKVTQNDGAWKRLPPTEAQILYLQKLGIYDETADYTRGQISEIISEQPATEKQIATLAKFNYNVVDGCTKGQANLAFKELEEKGLITKRVIENRTPPPLGIFKKD